MPISLEVPALSFSPPPAASVAQPHLSLSSRHSPALHPSLWLVMYAALLPPSFLSPVGMQFLDNRKTTLASPYAAPEARPVHSI
jgi:hypothetical protein